MAIPITSGFGGHDPKKTQNDLLYGKLAHLVFDSECWLGCDALRFPSLLFFKRLSYGSYQLASPLQMKWHGLLPDNLNIYWNLVWHEFTLQKQAIFLLAFFALYNNIPLLLEKVCIGPLMWSTCLRLMLLITIHGVSSMRKCLFEDLLPLFFCFKNCRIICYLIWSLVPSLQQREVVWWSCQ